MKKGTKIALIVSACCIALGMILFFVGMAMEGFDFEKLSLGMFDTTHPVTKTADVAEEFYNIRIEDTQCDIQLLPSKDGTCSVVYTDNDLFTHRIAVTDQTLTITNEETGSWQDHFSFSWGSELFVKVYLPVDTLERLEITTASADIYISHDFSFREVSLSCGSGDINLNNINSDSLNAETGSGDIELDRVTVAGHMELETGSGDIEFSRIDSNTADLRTGSGDIEGTILNAKDFYADTGSGDIELPRSDGSAGRWNFDTGSGDIEIELS